MKPNPTEPTASDTHATSASNVCDLRVGGMGRPNCSDDMWRALHRLDGVEDVLTVDGAVTVREIQLRWRTSA